MNNHNTPSHAAVIFACYCTTVGLLSICGAIVRAADQGHLGSERGQASKAVEVSLIELAQPPNLHSPVEPEVTADDVAGIDGPTVSMGAEEIRNDGLVEIDATKTDIRPSEGILPEDMAATRFRDEGEIRMPEGASREWPLYAFWWEAPATCHRPLYFEQTNLERYGYGRGRIQPLLSGAHFFATIPALPYLMGAHPPRECMYTLGHYQAGSCVPYQLHYPPLSLRGALAEGAVVTGLIFLIP